MLLQGRSVTRGRMHSRVNGETLTWQFGQHVSAASRVNDTHPPIASETSLSTFDLEGRTRTRICPLEVDGAVFSLPTDPTGQREHLVIS